MRLCLSRFVCDRISLSPSLGRLCVLIWSDAFHGRICGRIFSQADMRSSIFIDEYAVVYFHVLICGRVFSWTNMRSSFLPSPSWSRSGILGGIIRLVFPCYVRVRLRNTNRSEAEASATSIFHEAPQVPRASELPAQSWDELLIKGNGFGRSRRPRRHCDRWHSRKTKMRRVIDTIRWSWLAVEDVNSPFRGGVGVARA